MSVVQIRVTAGSSYFVELTKPQRTRGCRSGSGPLTGSGMVHLSTAAEFWFSSPLCGQGDGQSAAAEVDHGDDGGGAVVAVAAVVDEADLAVEAFELGVRQAEVDGGEDLIAVG